MLKRIRELDAQSAENAKFQHEFEIKFLLHNQDFVDANGGRKDDGATPRLLDSWKRGRWTRIAVSF
jgi:hypothetical protein